MKQSSALENTRSSYRRAKCSRGWKEMKKMGEGNGADHRRPCMADKGFVLYMYCRDLLADLRGVCSYLGLRKNIVEVRMLQKTPSLLDVSRAVARGCKTRLNSS